MMNLIPRMINVADLQRNYRAIVTSAKKHQEPIVVLNNGEPDIVLIDTKQYNEHVKRMRYLEEESLLKIGNQAIAEYKQQKTITPKRQETLLDVLKRTHD